MIFLCILIEGREGVALMYVYVWEDWEHIVSPFCRTDRWMFTKLGREEVFFGHIRPGVDPEWGKNRSMSGPSPKDFFVSSAKHSGT